MANVNKVVLIGRLTKPVEYKVTPGGQSVANFSIATNESWKDKSGVKQERTEYHNIVLWGRISEIANQYLSTGSECYIEGKLQTRKWDDKEGNKRYTTEIVGQSLQLLGKKDGATQAPESQEKAW